jgi:hypothetical protein
VNKNFEEGGYKIGDTVRCVYSKSPGFYNVGEDFVLGNRAGKPRIISGTDALDGSDGDWVKVEKPDKTIEVTLHLNKEAPTGGPAAYYNLPIKAVTLNDLIEYKGDCGDWAGGDAFHLGNLMKALWRFGTKEGTSKDYDARKFIYTGCRLLKKYAGNDAVRKTLQQVLDDPQFKKEDK